MSFPKFCLLKNWGFGNLALGKILLPYVTHLCLVCNCYQRRQAEPSAFGGWVFTDEVVVE